MKSFILTPPLDAQSVRLYRPNFFPTSAEAHSNNFASEINKRDKIKNNYVQILHVQIGVIVFRAFLNEARDSVFLVAEGNLFQVDTALKANVFTPKVLLYFLYDGRAKV